MTRIMEEELGTLLDTEDAFLVGTGRPGEVIIYLPDEDEKRFVTGSSNIRAFQLWYFDRNDPSKGFEFIRGADPFDLLMAKPEKELP